MNYDLAGKIAVISGGTSGIGLATAKKMLEDGAEVFIVGRNAERGRRALHTLAMFSEKVQYIKADVATVCVGQAASMGALLLCGGQKGKRSALTHSRIMIHQPLGGFKGQASDIDIHAREMARVKKELNQILAFHSGNNIKQIEKDTDRDNFMSALEAKDYGLIDSVFEKREINNPS